MKTLLLLLLPLAVFGQGTMVQTTASKAIAVNDRVIYPASTTGMSAASVSQSATLLLIDREAMQVLGASGGGIAVARGVRGTLATAHASGATVWVGSPELFAGADPAGSCVSASQRILPVVVVATGRVFDCTAGLWVDRAAGSSVTLDTDSTMAANSDTVAPSQKAVKTALDSKAGLGSNTYSGTQTISGTVLTNAEYDNGTCTTAKTIDPVHGNRQKVTLTNAQTCALTFTQPTGATASIQLKIIQSAAGSFNGTISGGKWPGATVPTITATTGAVDIASCYLDGTNAYCVATADFR